MSSAKKPTVNPPKYRLDDADKAAFIQRVTDITSVVLQRATRKALDRGPEEFKYASEAASKAITILSHLTVLALSSLPKAEREQVLAFFCAMEKMPL